MNASAEAYIAGAELEKQVAAIQDAGLDSAARGQALAQLTVLLSRASEENFPAGPNMLLMPGEVRLRHVATPADVIGILQGFNVQIEPTLLQATELRLAGNALAVGGELESAVSKYQQALALNPSRGQHMLFSNLSAAYLQLGKQAEALQAAQSAVQLAPKGFHMAHVRYVDALYASGKFEEAAGALAQAVAQDGSFKSIPEFKMMEQALRKYKPKVNAG